MQHKRGLLSRRALERSHAFSIDVGLIVTERVATNLALPAMQLCVTASCKSSGFR